MTQASTERTLGLILGKLEAVDKTLEKSDESRKKLYDKIDQLADKINATDDAVQDIGKRLKNVEPTIADINKWRERGIGAWLLVIGMSAALGGVISKGLAKLWALVTG